MEGKKYRKTKQMPNVISLNQFLRAREKPVKKSRGFNRELLPDF